MEDTIMKNVNWQKDNLENLLDILIDHRGITPKKLGGNWSVSGVPALSAKNIKTGKIVNEQDIRFVNQKLYEKWMPEKLEDGDILLTSEAPLGELYFLKEKKDYVLSQRLFALRTNGKKLNSRYLYYYLQGSIGRQELMRRLSGTAAEGIRQAELRKIEVEFPEDILEQDKIASVISAFDDKIEVNNKIAKTLQDLAQALFKEWFVHFRFPGYEKVEFVDSELGVIPKTWKAGLFGDIAYETREIVDPRQIDQKTPYFGIEHLPRKSLILSVWGYAGDVQSAKLEFYIGDILFGKIRPYFHKVVVAPVPGVCSTDILVIKPTKNSYFGIVLNYIFSDNFIDYASKSSQGTNMPRAKWEALRNYPIIIPDEKTLDKYNDLANSSVNKIKNIILENQKLAALRDLLLPKLMRGEIKV